MTIKTVDTDFHDDPRPVRVRFAPTVPDGGGAFLHCGHLAMLIMAAQVAKENNCPLDFRFDGEPDIIGALDCMNAVAWLQIPVRRFYTMIPAGMSEIEHFANGDKHLADELTSWHIASGFDDLYLENHTVIVRGIEFAYKPIREKITLMEKVWGVKPYSELLYPILMRDGQKMSKSLGNSIHWSVLKEYPVEAVKTCFIDAMASGENYEWKQILKQLAARIQF